MAAIQTYNNNGFMLPSVIIISTALLIITLALVQLVINNNQTVTRAMYSQIAQTAAKSGVDYAKEQFVATGSYNGTSETAIIQNGKYRVTFTVTVLNTSSDGLRKEVESIGRVYLPELSTSQLLLRSVRSDIIRTTATELTPDQLSPMAWYDADDNPTLHTTGSTTANWTHLNTASDDYLNERTSNGTQTNGSWNASWMGIGYSSQLGTVYAGTLFDLSGVPKGATINSAQIRYKSQGTTIGLSWVNINALDPSDVPASNSFSAPSTANQLRNKSTIGPTQQWVVLDWPVGNQDQFTSDISDLVQAVLDDPDFDPATDYIGFRLQRVFGLGTHRVNKADASLVVNYTTAGNTTAADGDPVTTWDDKSGNGRHLIAPGGREPTYLVNQQNGRPMVDFPYGGGTTGKYMSTAQFDLVNQADAGTTFILSKTSSSSGSDASLMRMEGTVPAEANCVGSNPCTTRIYELARSGSSDSLTSYIERTGVGGASALTVQTAGIFSGSSSANMIATGVAFAVGSCNPGINEASLDIAHDRTTSITCPSSGTYPKSFKDDLTLTIARGRNDARFSGQIGELIMYDRQLSCQEVQSIQKYLRRKWFNDTSDTNIIACPSPAIPGF